MIYPYIVNKNGVWYPAGADVPEGTTAENKIVNDDFSKYMNKPVESKSYTKTEINRMPTAELQALALENGVDGANEMTGAELKKVLIEHFGL